MSECGWMCLNKQYSEYASGPKYAKILNMAGFQYVSVTQCSEYARMSWQNSEYILRSKYARVLNIQELHRVLNMPQFNRTWICLNLR